MGRALNLPYRPGLSIEAPRMKSYTTPEFHWSDALVLPPVGAHAYPAKGNPPTARPDNRQPCGKCRPAAFPARQVLYLCPIIRVRPSATPCHLAL